jgi:hypothetical protein
MIDEVAVYEYALTSDQVAAHYTAGINPQGYRRPSAGRGRPPGTRFFGVHSLASPRRILRAMATLKVRYRDGSEEDWELHDAVRLRELAARLNVALAGQSPTVAFGVAAESGDSTQYGIVILRLADVTMASIDGMTDEGSAAALFAELEALTSDGD